jgi:hypothetical protein
MTKKTDYDIRDLLYKAVAENRGLLVTEIVPLLQAEMQIDPEHRDRVEFPSINENGVADLLEQDDRYEVTEGSRWRLKADEKEAKQARRKTKDSTTLTTKRRGKPRTATKAKRSRKGKRAQG